MRISRVAVVGASSQIGQALLPLLLASEYSVYPIGRSGSSEDRNVTYVFDAVQMSFTPPLANVDALISLAPLPLVGLVLDMAEVLGARRVIAFGSTGRFTKVRSTSSLEREFVAQQEQAERVLVDRCNTSGIAWTLFRPTMIYGADADLNVSFVRAVVRRFGIFPIPLGAKGLRQPVHVGDLAAACLAALGNSRTWGRDYNLGGGEVLAFPELVRRIFAADGKPSRILPVPLWAYRLVIAVAKIFPQSAFVRMEMVERMYRDLTADNSAARDDFGYEPRPFSLR